MEEKAIADRFWRRYGLCGAVKFLLRKLNEERKERKIARLDRQGTQRL